MKNLQMQTTGATSVFSNVTGTWVLDDVQIPDANMIVAANGINVSYLECEISGVNQHGDNTNSSGFVFYRTYLHDFLTAASIRIQGTFAVVIDCIVDRAAVNAFEVVGQTAGYIFGTTVYRAGGNGVSYITNGAELATNCLVILDSIFKDNGNVSTEANLDLKLFGGLIIERRNIISIGGALGGVNALGYTLDASDLTTDPLFIDPDNATVSLRNFGLQPGSPARGRSFPFGASGTITYKDTGAVQSAAKGPRARTMIGM